jgi:hypothetical protein
MEGGGAREVFIVAAHAHELLLLGHAFDRIGDAQHLAAGEEWIDALALGRHHLHAPGLGGQRRHRHQVVRLHEIDGLLTSPRMKAGCCPGGT